jgi:hypothetical protein
LLFIIYYFLYWLDLLGVDNQRVTDYNKKCKEIVSRHNLSHLSFDDLENYIDKSDTSDGLLIEKIAEKYLPPDFDLESAIAGDLAPTYLGFRYIFAKY